MRQKYINHAEFSDVLMVRSHAFKRPGLWLKPFFGLPPDLGHAGVEFLEPLCIKMDLKAGVISSKNLDPDNGDRHSIQIAL